MPMKAKPQRMRYLILNSLVHTDASFAGDEFIQVE
jgi:hypothetical protein